MELFTDGVTAAVERALDGVAERQRVAAHNVSNVATPGFKAKRVEFEASLARAMESGDPRRASIVAERTNGFARADGNDVSLEEETATLIRSGLQFDTLVASLNHKFNLLRTAIGRR